MKTYLIIISLSLLTSFSTVSATPILVSGTLYGHVTNIEDDGGALSLLGIGADDPVEFSYTFEGDPFIGPYGSSADFRWSVIIDGYSVGSMYTTFPSRDHQLTGTWPRIHGGTDVGGMGGIIIDVPGYFFSPYNRAWFDLQEDLFLASGTLRGPYWEGGEDDEQEVFHYRIDYLVDSATSPIPEPTTIALLGIGLVGLAGAEVRRRRKKKAVDNS